MIIPKYDNRYFGSIAERFEEMARERGLLPIITCTRRRPELEIEAVKAMLSGRLTGWSRPGRPIRIKFPRYASRRACQRSISTCRALSPSVISDNYGGAKALTHKITANSARRRGELAPLTFIGGRSSDHNTSERLRGFHDAHRELGLSVPQANILAPGYSKGHVEDCLQERFGSEKTLLQGIFVNSTISLEGVVRWLSQVGLTGSEQPPMGCFDWDPLSTCWGTISTWCSRTCRRCWTLFFDY